MQIHERDRKAHGTYSDTGSKELATKVTFLTWNRGLFVILGWPS